MGQSYFTDGLEQRKESGVSCGWNTQKVCSSRSFLVSGCCGLGAVLHGVKVLGIGKQLRLFWDAETGIPDVVRGIESV